MHRCESDYSIQIDGYNFTDGIEPQKTNVWNIKMIPKNGKNSFRKNSLTIKAFAKEKYWVGWYTCKDLTHL